MKKAVRFIVTLIWRVLIPLFAFSLLSSLGIFPFLPMLTSENIDIIFIFTQLMIFIPLLISYYLRAQKKGYLDHTLWLANLGTSIMLALLFTITFVISQGALTHPAFSVNYITAYLFLGTFLFSSLFSNMYSAIIIIAIVLAANVLITTALLQKRKYLLHCTLVIAIFLVINLATYFNSANYKYQGHGFTYMNGYSSVDLSDYTPYSDSGKLVTLDHTANVIIENETDMPILDGAEACYPVYSAIAKAIYKDIDIIEKEYSQISENGKIVTFYNTAIGYERLFNGEVDMFFGAKPSQSQMKLAEEYGVELEYTQIGKEAFVFFVNENNPIDTLSSEQIRSIYHGDITNFKEVGGKDEEIIAFQRPERSGSQSMMVYFMGDVPLKEPLTYETISAMSGIIQQVAEYHNENGALGYTFKYFLEGLNQEEDVKILSVDGIYPTTENIQNGSYPVVAGLYCVTVKGNDNENIQKVIDFLLSEDGQYIIEETGYCPID